MRVRRSHSSRARAHLHAHVAPTCMPMLDLFPLHECPFRRSWCRPATTRTQQDTRSQASSAGISKNLSQEKQKTTHKSLQCSCVLRGCKCDSQAPIVRCTVWKVPWARDGGMPQGRPLSMPTYDIYPLHACQIQGSLGTLFQTSALQQSHSRTIKIHSPHFPPSLAAEAGDALQSPEYNKTQRSQALSAGIWRIIPKRKDPPTSNCHVHMCSSVM